MMSRCDDEPIGRLNLCRVKTGFSVSTSTPLVQAQIFTSPVEVYSFRHFADCLLHSLKPYRVPVTFQLHSSPVYYYSPPTTLHSQLTTHNDVLNVK